MPVRMISTQMSIREVAAKAGVSLGTVSKAFDDNAKVSPSTRERIRRAATELGYHPSAVARAMVRKQMDTIGVIFPPTFAAPTRPPFYSTIFDALLEAATARQKDIALCTGRQWVDASTSLAQFRDGRCDGFITFWQPSESDLIPTLLHAGVPVVLLNDRGDDPRLNFVDIDSVVSARTMTEHLLRLGHRRIALLCGDKPVSSVIPREEGYRTALEDAGIAYDPALNPPGTFEPDSIFDRIESLLALHDAQRPTALFCATDSIALVALRVLRQKNLRVPEDISVAGHDDLPGAAQEHPALTTMRQPFLDIAERALDLLLAQEQNPSSNGRHVLMPAQLVVRASTAPPSALAPQEGVPGVHSENKEVYE
jgi:LacI family transcriptional regulator